MFTLPLIINAMRVVRLYIDNQVLTFCTCIKVSISLHSTLCVYAILQLMTTCFTCSAQSELLFFAHIHIFIVLHNFFGGLQHCGYDTSRLYGMFGFDPTTTLPLCTDSERTHDMHHRLNAGNYGGAYFVLDRLFGTWLDPDLEQVNKRVAAKED